MTRAAPEIRTNVTSAGVRLVVREWAGDGRALLLLHGLASSSHIFDRLAPRLAGEFRVVAYDQRGHGMSGKPRSGYGFAQVADDALGVMRALSLDRPVLLGHSWGANVGLEVCVRYASRVAGAVLLDGGFITLRDLMNWETTKTRLAPPPLAGLRVDEFLGLVRGRMEGVLQMTPDVEAMLLSLMRVDASGRIRPRLSPRNHLRILRAMWEQDTLALLQHIRVPVLVLATRRRDAPDDERRFIEAKREASATVRAIDGHVRFAWVEGIHDLPLHRPEALARRVGRFARGVQ